MAVVSLSHYAQVIHFLDKFTRSVGLMDKASASGAGDPRFESWADQGGRVTYGVRLSCVVNPKHSPFA